MIFAKGIYRSVSKTHDLREELSLNTTMRPMCPVCNRNPVAPNYWRDGVRHYRSRCSGCIKKDRNLAAPKPRWQSRGYKKKPACDLCGFRASYGSQLAVYHIDGDLNNSDLINLRTICLCCVEVVKRKTPSWRIGDLVPD
jgi:hypothetical protein